MTIAYLAVTFGRLQSYLISLHLHTFDPLYHPEKGAQINV